MKQPFQYTLFGLTISLLLSGSAVSAAPPTPEPSDVKYHRYHDRRDPEGQKYHDFLAAAAPEGLYYNTRKTAIGNVDDTPKKRTLC